MVCNANSHHHHHRHHHHNAALLLFLLLATSVPAALCMDTTTQEPGEPEILVFSLDVYHIASTVSSIELSWRVLIPHKDRRDITVNKFRFTIKNAEVPHALANSGSTLRTPAADGENDANEDVVLFNFTDLPPSVNEYVVSENLTPDTRYNVCVVAFLTNRTEEIEYSECVEVYTIPYFRRDSIVVLCSVIGVLLFLVLIGCLAWRCAVCSANRAEGKAGLAGAEKGDAEKGEDAPFLVAASTTKKPELETRRVFRPTPVGAAAEAVDHVDVEPSVEVAGEQINEAAETAEA